MKLFLITLIVGSALAYPQKADDSNGHNFLDTISKMALFSKIQESTNSEQLLSCLPQDHREKMNKVCQDELNGPSKFDKHTRLHFAAECILVSMGNILNNETRILDVNALKEAGIAATTLSAEQKKLASASLDSCIVSEDKPQPLHPHPHPPPPPSASTDSTDGTPVPGAGKHNWFNSAKYDHLNSPFKAMMCLAKALMENGCPSPGVKIL